MGDYISRDEIFSVWRSMPKPASISSLTDAINRTPAADVEPVRHGRKIEDGDIGVFYLCSLCGECLPYGANYCPYCGAKMELEDETNDD